MRHPVTGPKAPARPELNIGIGVFFVSLEATEARPLHQSLDLRPTLSFAVMECASPASGPLHARPPGALGAMHMTEMLILLLMVECVEVLDTYGAGTLNSRRWLEGEV